jgi:hypothetical protein
MCELIHSHTHTHLSDLEATLLVLHAELLLDAADVLGSEGRAVDLWGSGAYTHIHIHKYSFIHTHTYT